MVRDPVLLLAGLAGQPDVPDARMARALRSFGLNKKKKNKKNNDFEIKAPKPVKNTCFFNGFH